ncbi:MAG: hypothetical protein ACLUOS_18420 [Odoribacter splanchnicus]
MEEVDADDYIQWLTNISNTGARLDRIAFIAAWYGVEISGTKLPLKCIAWNLEELSLDEVVWALRKITGRTVKKEGGVYRIE